MPTSLFWTAGSSAEAAANVEETLTSVVERPEVSRVTRALEELVRYYERRLVTGEIDGGDHRKFQQRVSELLGLLRPQVVSFVFQTNTTAEAARDDEQLAVSWRRSAIQIILDEHAQVIDGMEPSVREQVHELIELIDDELRRMGGAYGRLPEEDLPRGLPRTHWWWFPDPIPGYQRWQGWDEPR